MATTETKKSSGTTDTKKNNSTRKSTTSGTRKNSNAGNKTTKSKTSTKVVEPEILTEPESFITGEVLVLLLLGISILLLLATFGVGGVIGKFFNSVLFGMFGIMCYLFPFLLFLGTAFYISNQGNRRAMMKLSATILSYMVLSTFFELVLIPDLKAMKVLETYTYSMSEKTGGGLLGGLFAKLFVTLFGTIGAFVVVIILAIICAVLITQRSFIGGVKKGSKKVYRSARVSADRHIEKNRERQAQRQQRRVDKKVSGVANISFANEKKAKEKEEKNPELMHEITIDGAPIAEQTLEGSYVDMFETVSIMKPVERVIVPPPEPIVKPDITLNHTSQKTPNDMPEPIWNIMEPVPVMQMEMPEPRKQKKSAEEITKEAAPDNADQLEHIPEELTEENPEFQENTTNSPQTNVTEADDFDYNIPIVEETLEQLGMPGIESINSQEQIEKPSAHTEEEEEIQEPDFDQAAKILHDTLSATSQSQPQEEEYQNSPYKSTIEVEEEWEAEETTALEEAEYIFPPLDILKSGDKKQKGQSKDFLESTAQKLQQTLQTFGVDVKITNVSCGPAVTRFEIQPEMGVKVSKIVNLQDDLKLNLAVSDMRIEAPIPGKAAIGIEIPNKESTAVMLRDLLEDSAFQDHKSKLAFAAGKDIAGKSIVADIGKMPHLLIAGATGSGKSVCINTIIMSILYKSRPDEVQFIMVDPKVVELSVYNGIPHLMLPVVTDPKKASAALQWACEEMDRRYELFAQVGAREINAYNDKISALPDDIKGEKPEKFRRLVIIIDELADLMMVAPGDVENSIVRLTQKARAAGIHLVIATQRPSVNVITGLIKANVPSRIAFAVSSGVDSRTILDMNGAEQLLGKGDMLFFPQGYKKPVRVQCAFVSDNEVINTVNFIKDNNNHIMTMSGAQEIEEKIAKAASSGPDGTNGSGNDSAYDELFEKAGRCIIEKNKASISVLQRVLKVGYNRASRIMEQLYDAGVVGEEEGTKPRKVLMSDEQFDQYIEEYF